MKVLLSGSSGFVGSHFVDSSSCAIAPFSFRHDDLVAFDFKGVDAVVHLAALVHRMEGAPEEEYFRVNTEKTLDLARRAKAAGVGYFLFMSTVKVYGKECEKCYSESDPCHPVDAYGRSKLEAERGLLALEDEGFRVGIVRSPLVYGSGVRANMLQLMRLVVQMPLLPFGGIANRRSLISVENLVRCLEAMVQGRIGGVYNVADPRPLSTTALVTAIARHLGKRRFIFPCLPMAWLLRLLKPQLHRRLYGSLCVETERLHLMLPELGLQPTEEGIATMAAWYRDVA